MNETVDYSNQEVIIPAFPNMRTAFVSNEYTDQLEHRINTHTDIERNYDRAIRHAQSHAKMVEYRELMNSTILAREELIALKSFIEECIKLRNEDDMHNNVGRFCTIPGDIKSRQWQVVFPMQRDDRGWRTYLIRKVNQADVFKVVSLIQMTQMY